MGIARQILGSGADPQQILEAVRAAMNTVEQRLENGEYFLPELVLSGEMVRQITEIVKPKLARTTEAEPRGWVLMSTVQGDIHDLGKNVLGNDLKIVVGGGQISDTIGAYTGADAFGRDAVAAVRLVRSWTKKE